MEGRGHLGARAPFFLYARHVAPDVAAPVAATGMPNM